MPVDEQLLNAPSGEEIARRRLSLYRSVLALAARIADVSYKSTPLEHQLDIALVFLASDECPPANKLHEKLSQIQHLVATTEGAVDRHENQRRHSNTPPQKPPPVPELSFSAPLIIEQPEPGPPQASKRVRASDGIIDDTDGIIGGVVHSSERTLIKKRNKRWMIIQ